MAGHHHSHDHHHHHHHAPKFDETGLNRAFIAGIVLNTSFVIIEVIAGFYTNSLSLLTDAGHNLADVAALALSLFAFRMAKVKADEHFTYGYSKTTILVALVNAVVLLIGIGGIGYEAVLRLITPEATKGTEMAIVAAIGIVINATTALLFFRDKEHDLNVKGAYLHMATDALVSLGVVIGGVLIVFTKWYWLDSTISILIMVVILYSTWGLLKDSVRLSLDAVPRSIDIETVRHEILKVTGVNNVHHIHVWAISTQVNALTAHLVINEHLSSSEEQKLKENVKHGLHHLNIQHATLETERGSMLCKEEKC